METVTLLKEEYEKLREAVLKIEIIEEIIHQPELSAEAKKELAEARAAPRKSYLKDEEMAKEFS